MSKRELIEPHAGDKRYIRRDEHGRITESDDVERSLSQDKKRELIAPRAGDKRYIRRDKQGRIVESDSFLQSPDIGRKIERLFAIAVTKARTSK